ncbi:hypothetical protein SSX86_019225 [Deinandra increscens subsp. villosa]|uniref:Uncharacterized protein n=1 Tax=Deinandra increscens subsp. villosa TaxID=3103831 RepID=A0AAP0GUA7_9ASTR
MNQTETEIVKVPSIDVENPHKQQHQMNNIPSSPANSRPPPPKLPRSDLINGPREIYLKIGVPLYEASIKCDWKAAKAIFDEYPKMELVRCSITENGETALHVAASAKGHKHVDEFVENLVGEMTNDDLELQNLNHNTAFYLAVVAGNIKAIKIMLGRNKSLLTIAGSKKGTMMPLYTAALFGNEDVVKYLYNNSKKLCDDGWTDEKRGWLLLKCVENDMFDVALEIVKTYPELGSQSVLEVLARKPEAFSKTEFSIISSTISWGKHLYSKMLVTHQPSKNELLEVGSSSSGPVDLCQPFPEAKSNIIRRTIKSVSSFMGLEWGSREKEDNALQLLRIIWGNIAKKSKKDIDDIIRGSADITKVHVEAQNVITSPTTASNHANATSSGTTKKTYSSRLLFVAAETGNVTFIVELIRKYPDLIWKVNDNNQSIFHIAVKHRHEGIYNLLYEIGSMKNLITPLKDQEDNNMLHLVGKSAKQKRLKDVSGVALQMQRELLWFKEVEAMIPPSYRERKNKDGLTPYELFTEEHKDLVTQGENWMKGTASQCMVVAALITTIVFAAAFTVPGGYNQTNYQQNGIPVFHSKATFMVFVVADAIALFASSASLLMFLSILTSRYAERDFLDSLPKKLILGLEMDISYLMRNLRPVIIIACGGCLICTLFAFAISTFVYEETGSRGSRFTLALVITVVLANTASPIVFRLAADLKFATSDIGRLAVSSCLIGDMYAVFILVIISGEKNKRTVNGWALMAFCSLLLLVGIIIFTTHLVNWLNKRNRDEKNLQAVEVMLLCSVIIVAAMILETMGFSSIIACFLMGSTFPRGGKSARTLLAILTYTVRNFIFPIYFGYTGFKADTSYLNELIRIAIVLMVIVLSIGGKIVGTLAACWYLKTPLNEGVLLAFLMNMKGHVDILTLTTAMQNKVLSSSIFYNLMVSSVVISSLISAALINFLVKRESDIIGAKHIPMEYHSPDNELKLLTCVHSRHPVNCMVKLIVCLRGSDNIPISPYLMHLIELPEKDKKNSSFHEEEEDEFSDDEDEGSNDAKEINEAVDTFIEETKMMIHQVKTVSPFVTMYQDVCHFADDIRASFIVLPFHKHQRIDGKFENDKDGIRTTNQKVLRNAQCSVAILVDRGHITTGTEAGGSESLLQIATLFFGGPDDREALGFSKRLSTHHHSSLTIIRFLPTSAKDPNEAINVSRREDDVIVSIQDQETEVEEADSSYLANFYHRYVTSGKVRFVEKYVENGAETGTVLREMAETYSMFVVGKGGRGDCLLTTGISDWEECPELGVVGDFLASSEFAVSGSVLVVQQHR